MLPAANAWAFALAAFALIVIPGPSVLFVIGRSLSLGRRGGMLSLLGNALGMLPAIALVALGVGAVVAESAIVFAVIKYLGAAYVIYLGVQAIRHRKPKASSEAATTAEQLGATLPSDTHRAAASQSAFRLLREGFIVGATNPKTLVFFVAILPQFVSRSSPAVPLQLALLGLIFFAIALLSDSVWALTASTARQWFARDPKRMSRMSATGGAMMIGLGGALALSGNKH
ncbi:LysE family translocator [Leucobacter sp. UT-8R-CII-1-4]|uniref:LysE family translocator n=1 Tax=Leucobacter sp. UT-8R-CII-1-4 TaxID=3040075 RepID=UPI0024A9E59C|nr:LysE family translocator [Leucobacter sp. UT-8R-CII-1-4]MDI6022730.1 LysE family translocator [Leucobacter sp. UT-8R-CII-1-4]